MATLMDHLIYVCRCVRKWKRTEWTLPKGRSQQRVLNLTPSLCVPLSHTQPPSSHTHIHHPHTHTYTTLTPSHPHTLTHARSRCHTDATSMQSAMHADGQMAFYQGLSLRRRCYGVFLFPPLLIHHSITPPPWSMAHLGSSRSIPPPRSVSPAHGH
jgi:hypothetical protein